MNNINKEKKDLISRLIIHSLANLPEQDRRIFILKHYRGCSPQHISRRLQLDEVMVSESLRRSARHLLCSLNPLKNRLGSEE